MGTASTHDLVDERAELAALLRSVLGADSVTPVTPERHMAGWGVSALDDHQFVVSLPGGDALLVRRAWPPFADTELVRAFAVLETLDVAERFRDRRPD